MRDIIHWLLEIERLAGQCYYASAEYYAEQDELHQFLSLSSEEEAWHFHIMGSALHLIETQGFAPPIITVDAETKERIANPFNALIQQINTKTVTLESLIDCVVDTEYSEWNDIFLLVVNTLKKEFREFFYASARIQHHLRHIQFFLETHPHGRQRVRDLQQINRVFTENILIVEDDQAVATFLTAVLKQEGRIDVARDGQAGLRKLEKKYYKLILSDIDMPTMNGITFYKRATAKYPNISNRFIFFTGDLDEERKSFFDRHKIPFLVKPSPLKALKELTIKTLNNIHT